VDARPELICFTNYFMGGVANFWYNILKNDPDNYFTKKVIYLDYNGLHGHTKLLKKFNLCPETVFTVDENEHDNVFDVSDRLEKLISHQPGVVLANSHVELSTLYIHRRPEKKIIFVYHDALLLETVTRYASIMNAIICHNPSLYTDLRKALPDHAERIHHIPYGIPLPDFIRTVNFNSHLRIVWLARVVKEKGIYDLIGIDKLLNVAACKVKWTIIGNGPELSNFKTLVNTEDNFTFFNPVEYSDVLEIVKNNDIFILPSRIDGLPVALLETMSVGCVPVISEFNEGIKEVVKPSIGYVVEVGNNQAFADAIVELNNDREKLSFLGKNAQSTVQRNYNIEIQAKKYFALFKDVHENAVPVTFGQIQVGGKLDKKIIPRWLRIMLRRVKSGASTN
jgi:glycosyltransferase involved in cell wall biosynthesis